MKTLILALLVAVVTAVPVANHGGGPVEVIVNGVPEGHGLDIGNIVGIDLHKQVNGETVAIEDSLHPFSTAGIIKATNAAKTIKPAEPELVVPAEPEPVMPAEIEPIMLAEPTVQPERVVEPEFVAESISTIVLPEIIQPEVVFEPVVVTKPPQPKVVPESVVQPQRSNPTVISPDQSDVIILPAAFTPPELTVPAESLPVPSGIIYKDGVVDVTVSGPNDYNVMGTLKNWFNMVINYITDGGDHTYTQQVM